MPRPRLNELSGAKFIDYVRLQDGSMYVRIASTVVETMPGKVPIAVTFTSAKSAVQVLRDLIADPVSPVSDKGIFTIR